MFKLAKEPIDRSALVIIFILSLLMALLISFGKIYSVAPKVEDFSWQSKEIGSHDIAFILTFDRLINHESVVKNLKISPPLLGKFSWAGRRMAFTLDNPIPYGENFQLTLQGATDIHGQKIQPFVGNFKSRDSAFAYIGTIGQERGRLILYDITQKQKVIITPGNLEVSQFKFYSSGDKILFEAAQRGNGIDSARNLDLYRLTLDADIQKPPILELLLDSKEYQNNDFDLSQDGKNIIIERVQRQNASNFNLWSLKDGEKPQSLKIPSGQFMIAPDSQTLAVAQGQGVGILPLTKDAKPLDFLPKFGQILNFSPDGRAAVFINFNQDKKNLSFLRSLYYVNNSGISKELLRLSGSILNCQFNPQSTALYCLLTKVTNEASYQEIPYFVRIDIKTAKITPLITLPSYEDIGLSLSPDGLAILFDQVEVGETGNIKDGLITNAGEKIIDSNLWLLIPPFDSDPQSKSQLQKLPINGVRPQWKP